MSPYYNSEYILILITLGIVLRRTYFSAHLLPLLTLGQAWHKLCTLAFYYFSPFSAFFLLLTIASSKLFVANNIIQGMTTIELSTRDIQCTGNVKL